MEPKGIGPGKYYRAGLTLIELFEMLPSEPAAEQWFINARWPYGIRCPICGSDNVQEKSAHPYMHHRCRPCSRFFSAKTNTVMQRSKLGYRTWAIAIYLLLTNQKGVSSMKLHRDLGIPQTIAWHLAHRIRKAWETDHGPYQGPLEIDESYFGGKERNKTESRRGSPKTIVVGAKDRASNQIVASVVPDRTRATLAPFINPLLDEGTEVYSDDLMSYRYLPNHAYVKHSIGQYVSEMVHTNGIESFWALMKRGYHGTYHKMSPKHLQRYIDEFSGRHNIRQLDTLMQMIVVVQMMEGKSLTRQELISGQ